MNRTITLIILIIGVALAAHAQITFQKTIDGHIGYSVQSTNDGGYIIAGKTWIPGGGGEIVVLIRMDSLGEINWMSTYGGTSYDRGTSVRLTNDNGFIVVGWTTSFGSGDADIYAIKTDSNGIMAWSKAYGGSLVDYGYAVLVTPDGGCLIAGDTDGFGKNAWDVFMIKINGNGDTLWTKTFDAGGSEYFNSIQTTDDLGYIITGTSASGGAGGLDAYLLKTDSVGNVVWLKTYGGSANDRGNSLQQTSDKGYIFAGSTNSFGAGSKDVYLAKTDSIGNLLWSRTFGGPFEDVAECVKQTSDGGYIIAGWTSSFGFGSSDGLLIRTDANGDTLWTRTFGGPYGDNFQSVVQTEDKGYMITGATGGFTSLNNTMYVVKTDSNGFTECNYLNPSVLTSTPPTSTGTFVITDSTGAGLITMNVASASTDSSAFDEYSCISCNSFIESGFSFTDSLLTVNFINTSNGAESWYWDFGDGDTSSSENPSHIYAVTGTYNVCLIASNICGSDTLCTNLSVIETGINDQTYQNEIRIYPNPFSLKTKIEFKTPQNSIHLLTIYDLTGKLIRQNEGISSGHVIAREGLRSGFYIFNLTSDIGTVRIGKLIVSD